MLFGSCFMVSNPYMLNLHNKTCVTLANPQWSIPPPPKKNQHWNRTYPLFSYAYGKCMFVDFLTECIGPPNWFTIDCGVLITIWAHSPISFFKCVFTKCVSWSSSLNSTPIKYMDLIKNRNQITLAYLPQCL